MVKTRIEADLPALIVGHDGSADADRALGLARALAERGHLSLTIARVTDGVDDSQSAGNLMDDTLESRQRHPGVACGFVVQSGSPAERLCRLPGESDILVLGSRGLGGFAGALVGSVSHRCLHESAAPVLVVPGGHVGARVPTARPEGVVLPDVRKGSIVVGHDGSSRSQHALVEALRLASALSVPVEVIRTWTIDSTPRVPDWEGGFVASVRKISETVRRELEAQVDWVHAAHPSVELSCHAVFGTAGDVLLECSQRALVLVVGSRGLGGFAGLVLGSVSTHCVQRSTVPVLVVRDRGRSES